MTLRRHLIPNTDAVYYIPDFISAEEEDFLVRKIHESPLPKWKQLANRRLQIWGGAMTAKRALVPEKFPAFVDKYPDIIPRIKNTGAFQSSPHGGPNHILMNEYLHGQGIMPHEDGPAYHPVVATLSLGSHAMFHYYQYKQQNIHSNEDEPDDSAGKGRTIDPTPVLSIFLERRSLIITASSSYNSFLHGIDAVTEDIFPPPSAEDSQHTPLRIANVDFLTGVEEREVVLNGGVLKRGTRYSLTCRDVEKVASVLPFTRR